MNLKKEIIIFGLSLVGLVCALPDDGIFKKCFESPNRKFSFSGETRNGTKYECTKYEDIIRGSYLGGPSDQKVSFEGSVNFQGVPAISSIVLEKETADSWGKKKKFYLGYLSGKVFNIANIDLISWYDHNTPEFITMLLHYVEERKVGQDDPSKQFLQSLN